MNERASDLSLLQAAARQPGQSWLPWLLISLVPVALALATWDSVGAHSFVQSWMRLYGIPALAVELGVFLYAVFSGADPLSRLGRLPHWAKAALLVLILIGFSTALFIAPNTLRAVTWTFCSIVHLLFGFGVASLAREVDSAGRLTIWKWIVLGLCGYLLVLSLFVAVALPKHAINWEFFGLGVTNIRQVGFYSATGACASLGLAAVQPRTRSALPYVVGAALMLALSFWSGTRGSLLAIFVAFSVGTIFLRILRSPRAWLRFLVAAAAGALLSLAGPLPHYLYGLLRLRESTGGGTGDVSSGRFDMWVGAWDAFLQRPLSGYGAGQYWPVVHDKLGAFNHPHNIVLQLLFQWGLIGAACYIALALLLFDRVSSALKAQQPADAPALLVLTSLLTMSLYEGSLFHSYPTMMIVLALSLIISPSRGRVTQ